jgi:hypothetical protein
VRVFGFWGVRVIGTAGEMDNRVHAGTDIFQSIGVRDITAARSDITLRP